MILFLKKTLFFGTLLVIFLFQAYLLRFKIFQIPTTFIEILIYLNFLLLILLLLFDKKEREEVKKKIKVLAVKNKMLVFGLFLLVAAAFVSSCLSSNQLSSFGLFKAYFLDPLIFFILFVSVFSYKNINLALNIFLASGIVVALLSLFYFSSGNLTYDGRLQGIFNSPNFLAMSLAPVILIAFWNFFFRGYAGAVGKLISLAALFVLVPVFFLTYSYGAFFGLFLALFFLGLASKRSVVFKSVFCLSLLFLAFSVFFLQADTKKTKDLLLKDDRSSLQSREMIWSASKIILKENYILGIGPGMFQKYYLLHQKDFKEPYLEWAVPYPHNIFLAFWIQLGILGILGFIFILIWVFKVCFFIIFHSSFEDKKTKKTASEAAGLVGAFFIYFLSHGLVDTPYWKNDLALTFFLFLSIALFLQQQTKTQE